MCLEKKETKDKSNRKLFDSIDMMQEKNIEEKKDVDETKRAEDIYYN
jgi:hypothetical protein